MLDQHGFSRSHVHLLAATSGSLPSQLAVPGHIPAFHFMCKSPAWVTSESLHKAERIYSSMLKRQYEGSGGRSVAPKFCLEKLLSGVSSDMTVLWNRVTEVLVKMQPEIASASVKAERFLAKCGH